MNKPDEQQIRKWAESKSRPIPLKLLKTEDPRTIEIEKFCQTLTSLAPDVSLQKLTDHPSNLPAIEVVSNLRFSGIPTGRELKPFLEALSHVSGLRTELAEEIRNKIKSLKGPAFLELYVTSQCPYCPDVFSGLIPLIFESGSIRLRVIDGILFHEAAAEAEVRSAPTLILNNRLRFTGSIDIPEVFSVLAEGDPAQMGPGTLESLLKEGEAERVALMMLEHGKIFPSFPDVLTHEKWSVRLGAMVVMEHIAAEDPGMALEAVGPIMARFEKRNRSVQGDMVYILGSIAGPETLPWLDQLRTGVGDPEFKAMVEEAILSIRERKDIGN